MRDEIDLIGANLDYHLARGFAPILVTDHGSTDGTAELLREYEQAGAIEIFHEGGRGFDQQGWVTRMAHHAYSTRAADWIFHLDADEFVVDPHANISEACAGVPRSVNVLSLARRNFVLREAEDAPFYERMTVRETGEVRRNGQVSSPKVGHRVMRGVTVRDGNHAVVGRHVGRAVPFDGALVLHYPLRGREQMLAKIGKFTGGLAALDRPLGKIGQHVRDWGDRVDAGGADDLYREWLYTDAEIEQGLASGALMIDTRVRDTLRSLTSTPKR